MRVLRVDIKDVMPTLVSNKEIDMWVLNQANALAELRKLRGDDPTPPLALTAGEGWYGNGQQYD